MTDRLTVRVVVAALALGVLAGLALIGWLASTQTPIPDALDRLTNLLAGGLIGVLASTRTSVDDPAPVQVVNEPDDPVNVEAVDD